MKWALAVVLSLAVLLQTVSNQDLTEEETAEKPSEKTPLGEEEEPTPAPFQPPETPPGDVYFAEAFTDPDRVWKTWFHSTAKKESGEAQYDGKDTLHALGRVILSIFGF
jgi:hypothetical protein